MGPKGRESRDEKEHLSFCAIDPQGFRNREKRLNDLRVELRAAAPTDFLTRVRHGERLPVGTVADHGIERVRDRQYPRTHRNSFTLQTAWIVGCIEEFLVRQHDFCGVAKERGARQNREIAIGNWDSSRDGDAKGGVGNGPRSPLLLSPLHSSESSRRRHTTILRAVSAHQKAERFVPGPTAPVPNAAVFFIFHWSTFSRVVE